MMGYSRNAFVARCVAQAFPAAVPTPPKLRLLRQLLSCHRYPLIGHMNLLGGRQVRFDPKQVGRPYTAACHTGGNPGANLKSISHRCHPILVAFVWELTNETIYLPLGCLQGGVEANRITATAGIPSSVSLGMMGARNKSVNFGSGKNPGLAHKKHPPSLGRSVSAISRREWSDP